MSRIQFSIEKQSIDDTKSEVCSRIKLQNQDKIVLLQQAWINAIRLLELFDLIRKYNH